MESGLSREVIAMRVAKEFKKGYVVNLGIGLPTMVADFVPPELDITLHAENGVAGYGRIATDAEIDPDLVNPGSQPIVLNPGAAFFDSVEAFSMIRGGHIDCVVLGAFQVSEKGDLANWMTNERKVGSIGGSMDFVGVVGKTIAAMEHTSRSGEMRIVKECTHPLTGRRVVNLIITNLAVIEVTPEGLLLKEVAPSFTPEEIQAVTGPRLIVSRELKEMTL